MKRRAIDSGDAVTLIPTSEEDLTIVAGGAEDPGPWTGPKMIATGTKEHEEHMKWVDAKFKYEAEQRGITLPAKP